MLCSSLGLPHPLRLGRVGLLISALEPLKQGFPGIHHGLWFRGLGLRV